MKSKFLHTLTVGVALMSLFAGSASATLITDKVTVNGQEWAQISLFTGQSWSSHNAQCPAGVCGSSSSLNGWDLDGWTWASVAEVSDLFNFLSDGAYATGATPHQIGVTGSSWAPAIVGPLFNATIVYSTNRQVAGFMSDDVSSTQGGRAVVLDHNSNTDYLSTSTSLNKSWGAPSTGGWFFRAPAAAVPEPSTLAIFALGMIGLASRRLRKSINK